MAPRWGMSTVFDMMGVVPSKYVGQIGILNGARIILSSEMYVGKGRAIKPTLLLTLKQGFDRGTCP